MSLGMARHGRHRRTAHQLAAFVVSVFVVAAWQLNPLCAALSPVALGWVFFYSYTKRFTRWSHLVLGVGLSIAPVGGFLAVLIWYVLVLRRRHPE